jgi:hypothetical protein
MLFFLFTLFCLVIFASSAPAPSTSRKRQDVSEPICGQIIDTVNEGLDPAVTFH